MLGIGLGLHKKKISSDLIATEYSAILDYATAQSLTLPSAAQQEYQNTLVKTLKQDGVWDKLDILYVTATNGNEGFALINWKNPGTHNLVKVGSPIFTTNQGIGNDGSGNDYYSFSYNPSVGTNKWTQDSVSIGVYVFSVTGNAYFLDWDVTNPTYVTLISTNLRFRINASTLTDRPTGGNNTGLFQVNRNSSTVNVYRNGAKLSTDATVVPTGVTSGTGVVGLRLFDFGVRLNGRLSLIYAGENLEEKASLIYNAFNTYLTSL